MTLRRRKRSSAPLQLVRLHRGLFGSECEHHQVIHLFEDTTLVENVDGGPDGQPVPPSQPGAGCWSPICTNGSSRFSDSR